MKHEIVVDIEGFQMRREMLSDSEDSYISELSDSDHEERKVEEQSSVRIASSVCGTNVTSQIKSRDILALYKYLNYYYYYYFDRAIRIPFFGTKWLNFKRS